jgi:hypothetical protein
MCAITFIEYSLNISQLRLESINLKAKRKCSQGRHTLVSVYILQQNLPNKKSGLHIFLILLPYIIRDHSF